jgi:ABC-type oligopeptide transport system ATPase subunit
MEYKLMEKKLRNYTKKLVGSLLSLHDNKYQQEDQEQKKLKLVKQAINCIADCYLDNGCTLMFKKLRNVCVSKKKITFS